MLAALVLASFAMFVGPAAADVPRSEAERQAAVQSLPWQQGGSYHLDKSQSTLNVPRKYPMLLGADATRFMELVNGNKQPDNIEAVVIDPEAEAIMEFKTIREGYVKFDDWADVDAAAMLIDIQKNTESANKERTANGMPPVEVVGWLYTPALDKAAQTVRWGLEGRSEGHRIINASVLSFGRYGYEQMIWIGSADQPSTKFVDAMRQAHAFDDGARYADFRDGDKVAEYGIAALIAGAVGAKAVAKFGLLAAALILFKKAWIIVAAAALGGLAAIRRFFGRSRSRDLDRS
ncbi:MAG TPA: DUF2167 domain-containing protein [Candidatus Cybelea sp.]|nr:DUF2167 domain-containing protein [Candidatus Cybelea sp.]